MLSNSKERGHDIFGTVLGNVSPFNVHPTSRVPLYETNHRYFEFNYF